MKKNIKKGEWLKNNTAKARSMGKKGGAKTYYIHGKKYFQEIGGVGGRKSRKLTEEQVIEIRSLKGKQNQKEIAFRFNVVPSTIHFVFSRKTWNHI